MLEPLAGPSTVGALAAGVMEAGRYAENQDKIKNGTARKRSARSYSDKFLTAINAQFASIPASNQTSGQRFRSVNAVMIEYKLSEAEQEERDAKAYDEFRGFVQDRLNEEGPGGEIRGDYADYIWENFKHAKISAITEKVLEFLRELVHIQESQPLLDLSNVNMKDMDVVVQSIRSIESNFTIQILQKAFLQMNLAQLMDTAFEEHQRSGGDLNRIRHSEQLYNNWDEKSKAAGHTPVEWTEEVRLGHRWIRWTQILSENNKDSRNGLGQLLALSGFKMPSGRSAVSFLCRKISNAEMVYAEVYIDKYLPDMRTLSTLLHDIAQKLISGRTVTKLEIKQLQNVIKDRITFSQHIEDKPDKGDNSSMPPPPRNLIAVEDGVEDKTQEEAPADNNA
ncbi:uncharacterized protein EAF01_004796 [Botrytis porri]|uniref:uncharacterized protein n=1 Tax=Botrytis porri TaxID=87229 RepID=UPI0018FF8322|nr:uncharacterized protein EAF01_004796 [Botrytis porri]KAF7907209.1 hypothetical protein EAF01_004796 [Botrytis porri]